jgi:hypothetical protein
MKSGVVILFAVYNFQKAKHFPVGFADGNPPFEVARGDGRGGNLPTLSAI